MAELALIIGNGFDIDMGIPSKYSDFANSPEFHDLTHRMHNMFHEEERDKSLVLQLQQASMKSNWFDIEEEIHQYVVSNTDINEKIIRLVRSEFDALKKALMKYLIRVSKNFKPEDDRLSCQLFTKLEQVAGSVNIINFNYTNPIDFLWQRNYSSENFMNSIHGNLDNKDIVLGCDIQEGEKVNRSLSFMYKYNMLHKATHIANTLLKATNIVFFGHSVNEMDFSYFREFFKAASSSPAPNKQVTFITFNEESERNIKDNIRNQGISVSDLYNNLGELVFIHSQKVYKGDKVEIDNYLMTTASLLSNT